MNEVDNSAKLKHELRMSRYINDATAAIWTLAAVFQFAAGNVRLGALNLGLGFLYVGIASSYERQGRGK